MKKLFVTFFLLNISLNIYCQSAKSDITVTGKVKNEKTFTKSDVAKSKRFDLNDLYTGCSPEKGEKIDVSKAVLLRDLLESVEYKYERSKELNQFYFILEATDGYRTVFSFNEIYNTEVGSNLYIIANKDGKTDYPEYPMLISGKDIKAGSRNLKNLSRIIVCKAE